MYDGISLHSVLYSSFECVKTFLGVTKGDNEDEDENHVDDNEKK